MFCKVYDTDSLVSEVSELTKHLDIVSYPLVAVCGMIATLLDSSVSFFFFFDVVPMFVFATWVN